MGIWGRIRAVLSGAWEFIGPLAEIIATTNGRAVARAAWRAITRVSALEGLEGTDRRDRAREIVIEELREHGLKAQARLIHACIEAGLVFRAVMAGEELVEVIDP